jgi:hypothetical protein
MYERLVYLVSVGHAIPVLEFIESSIATTDISLIQHFVSEA